MHQQRHRGKDGSQGESQSVETVHSEIIIGHGHIFGLNTVWNDDVLKQQIPRMFAEVPGTPNSVSSATISANTVNFYVFLRLHSLITHITESSSTAEKEEKKKAQLIQTFIAAREQTGSDQWFTPDR